MVNIYSVGHVFAAPYQEHFLMQCHRVSFSNYYKLAQLHTANRVLADYANG